MQLGKPTLESRKAVNREEQPPWEGSPSPGASRCSAAKPSCLGAVKGCRGERLIGPLWL